jgi:ribosome-associated translation inhibitor RaiA
VKRVEIVLHSPRNRDIVARGEAKFHGPAMTIAVDKLSAQVRKLRELQSRDRMRRAASARNAGTGTRTTAGAQG